MTKMRVPKLTSVGLDSAVVDFRFARAFDMYRHVKAGPGEYEPDVLAMLLVLLARNERARFINVGANIGYFALIVAKLFGARVDVHAYEPMPVLFDGLVDACRSNRVDVHLRSLALSDFEGTAPFHLSAKSDTSNSLNPEFRPNKGIVDVPVSTIDAEFADPSTDLPTVLLVDTESTEPAVLRGSRAFIERVRPAVVCEVLAGRTETELTNILNDCGYEMYELTDDGPQRRDELVGDRTYRHRDWLFVPEGADVDPTKAFGSTFRTLTSS